MRLDGYYGGAYLRLEGRLRIQGRVPTMWISGAASRHAPIAEQPVRRGGNLGDGYRMHTSLSMTRHAELQPTFNRAVVHIQEDSDQEITRPRGHRHTDNSN
jgi:hypothetical protein